MSDWILDFADARQKAAEIRRESGVPLAPDQSTWCDELTEAALEAQAQAAVAKVKALLASERRQCRFAHNALTAAEAALKAERERADKLADTISRTHSAQLIPPDGSHTQCTVCGAGDDEQSRIPWWI